MHKDKSTSEERGKFLAETTAKAIANGNLTKHTAQWFQFPYNYDPTWGDGECSRFDNTSERPPYVQDPMFNLLALMS